MLQQTAYASNPIIPHSGVEHVYGKKLVTEKCGTYLDQNKNAGVVCDRITELNLNSRKKTSNIKSDSSQMKDILNHSSGIPIKIFPSKRPLVSYLNFEKQQQFIETKLVPDTQGKMGICVGRKSGSAAININIDEYDLEKTYHTWKKVVGLSAPHNKSNLENDKFLTVSEDAKRYDRLPIIKNRNPPYANPDGPFEKERLNVPAQARDNLDRTLTPRTACDKICFLKKQNNINKDSFSLLRPHSENTMHEETRGVRKTNFPWINYNRIKNILSNRYEDETEQQRFQPNVNGRSCEIKQSDSYYNFQKNGMSEEGTAILPREINHNPTNSTHYRESEAHNEANTRMMQQMGYDSEVYTDQGYSNFYEYPNQQNCYQYSDKDQYYNKHKQHYNENENFSNYNNHVSHFGNDDINAKNPKQNNLTNESYCCNGSHEYVNNTSSSKDENLKRQNNVYRAPSLTEIY